MRVLVPVFQLSLVLDVSEADTAVLREAGASSSLSRFVFYVLQGILEFGNLSIHYADLRVCGYL